jgi:putative ABC transport system permease protein
VWWLSIMGRLKPDVSMTQATAQLNSIAAGIFHDTIPAGWGGTRAKEYLGFRFKMLPAGNGASNLREDYSTPLWILLGIAGLVLLIACANLANLMLARASAREREIAVRLAVGASRARITRQLLTESLLLAVCGAVLGFAVAQWASRFLVAFLGTEQRTLFLNLRPDWFVLSFTAAVAMLTCILFGLAPALKATRISPHAAMKAGSRSVTGGQERFGIRRVLVVAQVAMSLTLLFGALLFTRTLRNVMSVDAGFQQTGVLVTQLDFTQVNVPISSRDEYKRQIMERISAIAGVESAAEANIVPISGNGIGNSVWIPGTDQSKHVDGAFSIVGPGYFMTIGTPLLAGRDFKQTDTASSPNVAVVNETFAKKLGLGSNPVGKLFRREATSRGPEADFEIIGLVKDTKYFDLREQNYPIAYLAAEQSQLRDAGIQFIVRSRAPMASITSEIKSTIAEMNPAIEINFQSLERMVGDSLLQERLMATLSGFFGSLAALLATIGLYGVISYMVVRRTNEIGIRMALGADRSGIIVMILREAGILLTAGIVLGLILSLGSARTAKSLLYGLKTYDPLTLGAAVLLLAAVTVAASFLPARRASHLDPMVALREE